MSEETAYEHNMRYANAIGEHIKEVVLAVSLLKKCDYVIFTKEEFEYRKRNIWFSFLGILIFSFLTGFSFCMAIVKGGY